MSKYQGILTNDTFPALAQDDFVGHACAQVMVEGMPIAEAAAMYAVTQQSVSMRCKRIAEGQRGAQIKMHAQELYDLACDAVEFVPDPEWRKRLFEISDKVECNQ